MWIVLTPEYSPWECNQELLGFCQRPLLQKWSAGHNGIYVQHIIAWPVKSGGNKFCQKHWYSLGQILEIVVDWKLSTQ